VLCGLSGPFLHLWIRFDSLLSAVGQSVSQCILGSRLSCFFCRWTSLVIDLQLSAVGNPWSTGTTWCPTLTMGQACPSIVCLLPAFGPCPHMNDLCTDAHLGTRTERGRHARASTPLAITMSSGTSSGIRTLTWWAPRCVSFLFHHFTLQVTFSKHITLRGCVRQFLLPKLPRVCKFLKSLRVSFVALGDLLVVCSSKR
jgi:hypothetical protein